MSAECHDNFLVKLAEVSSFEKDENSGLLAFPTQVAVSRGTREILSIAFTFRSICLSY